jgi:hypothetical protein
MAVQAVVVETIDLLEMQEELVHLVKEILVVQDIHHPMVQTKVQEQVAAAEQVVMEVQRDL